MSRCNCYVSSLPPAQRFCIRFGAHAESCPVYRVSGDHVDRVSDEQFRAAHEPVSCPPSVARMLSASDADLAMLEQADAESDCNEIDLAADLDAVDDCFRVPFGWDHV